jgi:hypothetical protein
MKNLIIVFSMILILSSFVYATDFNDRLFSYWNMTTASNSGLIDQMANLDLSIAGGTPGISPAKFPNTDTTYSLAHDSGGNIWLVSPSIDLEVNISLCFWLNETSPFYGYLFAYFPVGDGIQINSNSTIWSFNSDTEKGYQYSRLYVPVFADNLWHHICYIRTNTATYVYKDGSLVDSQIGLTITDSTQAGYLYFGDNGGTNRCSIDEVALWQNRTLTADEVSELYNSGNGIFYPVWGESCYAEICDGVDNDCDGSVDEDLTRATTCGVGVCSGNTGIETCTTGVWEDTCNPFAGATPEICDYLDNDCNGLVDEEFNCTVGIGECTRTGTYICNSDGSPSSKCNVVAGTPTPDICDGLDNDCDGVVDEFVCNNTGGDIEYRFGLLESRIMELEEQYNLLQEQDDKLQNQIIGINMIINNLINKFDSFISLINYYLLSLPRDVREKMVCYSMKQSGINNADALGLHCIVLKKNCVCR